MDASGENVGQFEEKEQKNEQVSSLIPFFAVVQYDKKVRLKWEVCS